ncbi:thioredoxin domain-containing protein [Kluyvera sichuanensis]|uniref:DsbA family protein n=1 Tax=Kluyvera sichuanensis TaxID=2725494 RepID=UPI0039F59A96
MKHNVLSVLLVTTYINFLSTATAATPPVFTPEQEARIGQIATDYLVTHPEVLVTVSQKLQAQQRERQQQVFALNVMNHLQAIVADPDTPVVGPASASVAVIEFFDYQCVHCSHLAPTLEKVMAERAGAKFLFKEWPIFGERWPASEQAAERGLAIWKAAGADAYLKYHNGIFHSGQAEGALTAGDIENATIAAGMSPSWKPKDMSAALARNDDLAQTIGLTGTPGLIVMPLKNPSISAISVFPGTVSAGQLMAAIDKAGY